MKQNINEELNYIKYLLGYQKGVVISEQTTPASDTPTQPQAQGTPASEPTQGGDGCIPLTISGKFNPKKSDSTEYLTNIISQLDAQIKSKPEFQGGSVTSIRIIGGASNVDNGIKSDFTLNNDYTPSGTTPKQTKEFQNNMGYAQTRIDASKQPILDELKKVGLTVIVEPTTEAHVIDTGGTSDSKRNSGTHPNPGQVVIIQMTICPVKDGAGREDFDKLKPRPMTPIDSGGDIPTRIPELTELTPLYECFNGIEVDINFDRNSSDQGHNCSSAVWDVSANGVELYRESKNGQKVNYASLNNLTNKKSKKTDKYDDAKSQGKYRYNKFIIDEVTAKSFLNLGLLQKYQGELNIFMKCQVGKQGAYGLPGHSKSNGGCHTGTASIVIKTKEGDIKQQIKPPVTSGEEGVVYTIPACSGIYQRLVSQGVFGGK